jgi:hypothetical protein
LGQEGPTCRVNFFLVRRKADHWRIFSFCLVFKDSPTYSNCGDFREMAKRRDTHIQTGNCQPWTRFTLSLEAPMRTIRSRCSAETGGISHFSLPFNPPSLTAPLSRNRESTWLFCDHDAPLHAESGMQRLIAVEGVFPHLGKGNLHLHSLLLRKVF